MKRENPYTALKNECAKWAWQVINPVKRTALFFKSAQNESTWSLAGLYHRVAAADQLGYEVKLEARDDGLHAIYVKRIPDAPWSIRP